MGFFMKAGPSFFLECISLGLLYPSFNFDIWYVVCVCGCVCVCVWVSWSGFGFHLQLFFLVVCVNVCFEIFLCIYIYIYIYIYVCVCLLSFVWCTIHVLLNIDLNFSVKLFSFLWSSLYSFVWYIGIILTLPQLNWYRCFDTLIFCIFFYFDITPVEWFPCIKGRRWPYIYFFGFVTFNSAVYIFFLLQLKTLFTLNFVSGFLKV